MSTLAEGQYGDFLLERFRAFYAELASLRRQLQAGGLEGGPPEAAPADAEIAREASEEAGEVPPGREDGAGPRGMAEAVSQHLVELLRRDSLEAARLGGAYGARLFQEAQYVMAALADEIFLHRLEWPGRPAWGAVLLESRLFRSHKAGDQVFRSIDELLEGRSRIHAELAMIYLLALKLGFRGRHCGEEDAPVVEHYKERLYRFVANRAPNLGDCARHFFPDSYRNRLGDAPVRHLPHLRRWLGACALAAVAYVAIAHLLWHGIAAEILTAMQGRL